jgi:molecular chaperone DnaK (HSP70)
MSEKIIGIDLGTTNSEVAVIEDGQPVLIRHNNRAIVPSYVAMAQDGKLLVGEAARNQYPVYPERTVKSIKRLMGSGSRVIMAGREYAPREISAIILKFLKRNAEQYLGSEVDRAVITVPAYFSDIQRLATKEAGEIAGFKNITMINEPTAAALAYEGKHEEGRTVLVYDLGGGTFDVSVVRMEEGVIEVIASHGNNHLGGDDFDQLIIDHVYDRLREEHGEFDLSPEEAARITRAAGQAKHLLSDNPFAVLKEEYLFERNGVPVHLDIEISRETYEEMIRPLIDETVRAIHVALKSADLTVSDIEEILLVGGSTRTPLVRRHIEEEFSVEPRGEVDPDLCVASGAAIQAGMLAGEDVSAVLVDITPYTFGTGSLDMDTRVMGYKEVYVPLIKKNSPVPVRKSEVFYTMFDGQEKVRVTVYQGEESVPQDNIKLGEFVISGLSNVPEGSEIITTFELDTNGLLQVTATEKCTGKSKQITIDNATGRFDQEEMDRARGKLIELFDEETGADRDPEANRNREAGTLPAEAQTVLEKAENLLDNAGPEDREELIELSEKIRDALGENDKEKLAAAMDELNEIIFYMES